MMAESATSKSLGLHRLRLLYAAVYGSWGVVGIYRSIYYRRVGMSGSQIGVLLALQPLAVLAAGPLWSMLADRAGMRTRLLTILTGLSVLPMLGMIWMYSFSALLVLGLLFGICMGPVDSLMASISLAGLGQDRHKWARLRAFGSLGYGPAVWLTGLLIQGGDIRWIFVGYALLMGVACLVSTRLRIEQRVLPKSLSAGIGGLLRNRAWLIFAAAVFVGMVLDVATFGYVGLYLESLQASEGLIGFAGALGSAVQTLLMLTALPRLLRRWGSERLLALSFVAYVVRLGLWALVPVTWVITASESLMGLSFGAGMVASVDYADRHRPEGMAATSQALTGVAAGLGAALGGVLTGALYQTIGLQSTFGGFSLVAAVAAAGFGLLWRGRRPARAAAQHPCGTPKR